MSPFLWFAIVLTVVYIIYYTVVIMNDLYGKKSEGRETTEEIDVPTAEAEAIPDDAPIRVSESEEGFSVGDEVYDAMLVPVDNETEEVSQTADQEEAAPKPSPADAIRETTEALSEEIEPAFDDSFEDVVFHDCVMNEGERKVGNRPKVKVIPVLDEI